MCISLSLSLSFIHQILCCYLLLFECLCCQHSKWIEWNFGYFKCGKLWLSLYLTWMSVLWMLEFWFGLFALFEFLSVFMTMIEKHTHTHF
jgi:hypothetical protein